MNERIKELALQADITLVPTEFTGCLSGQDFLVTDRNITGRHLEKFAELIAAECINMIEAEAKIADDDSVHGMRNAAGLIGRAFNI
jgi:predicted naringenin-chalcone synthase